MKIAKLRAIRRRRRKAFTLVELLVVISIIAILASISTQVARIAMQRTRVAQAKVQIVSLENALHTYHAEYGSFPVDSGDPHPTEGLLMKVLMGSDDQAAVRMNRRRVIFFTTSQMQTRANAPGFVAKFHRLNDPWGTPFEVTADIDDSGTVKLPQAYHSTYDPGLPGLKLFIHSAGPDRDFDAIDDNITELE